MHSDLKKLPEPNQLAQRLQRILPRFAQIRWVAQIESTNPELIQQARAPNGRILKPWLLGAHYQTQGRGRAGRHWDNQPGTQLMFSCAFDVFLPSHQLPTLSPLLGIAACQGLRTLLPNHLQEKLSLKWPNDVMWGHAKLAGILTEVTRASASRISKDHYIVVVGIGINLQKAEHLSQLFNRPVADWSQISQTVPTVSTHGPEHLVAVIAHQWWKQLNEVTTHGFKNLISLYQSVDYLYRLPIHILNNGQITNSGIAAGINMQGQLLLQTGSQMYPISVGEISVRPQNETKP